MAAGMPGLSCPLGELRKHQKLCAFTTLLLKRLNTSIQMLTGLNELCTVTYSLFWLLKVRSQLVIAANSPDHPIVLFIGDIFCSQGLRT